MHSRTHPCTALVLLMCVILAPHAHAATDDMVCTADLRVDKEKLAALLLAANPVSTAYLSVGDHPAPLASARALAAWLLKKRATEKRDGHAVCQGDSCNVDRLAATLQRMRDGADPQFKAADDVTVDNFFDAANQEALTCTRVDARASVLIAGRGDSGARAATPAAVAASPTGWRDHLRVRGNPDQLSVRQTDQAAYASVDRAHLTLANDDVAQSRTNDIAIFAGYSFDRRAINGPGSTYEAVPYVGFKQNRVSTYDGQALSVTTTRTSQVGMLSALHFAHPEKNYAEDLTARPDYLINSTDGSRLLTANFTYTQIRPGLLNDFIRWNNGLAVKPILVAQSRNGIYANRGDATVYDLHQDFIRLGAQAGFTLLSENPALPFDFTTTFTSLKALRGTQSIHYWRASLNYNLNQNVGLSLDYSDGLLPDTADAERKWNLGISTKF